MHLDHQSTNNSNNTYPALTTSRYCCIFCLNPQRPLGVGMMASLLCRLSTLRQGVGKHAEGATARTVAGPSEPTSSLQSQAEEPSLPSGLPSKPALKSVQKHNTGFWRGITVNSMTTHPQYTRTNANRALKLQPRIWVTVGLKSCEPPPPPPLPGLDLWVTPFLLPREVHKPTTSLQWGQ